MKKLKFRIFNKKIKLLFTSIDKKIWLAIIGMFLSIIFAIILNIFVILPYRQNDFLLQSLLDKFRDLCQLPI